MTFRDLERRIRSNPILEQQSKPLFQRIRHRRYWIWNEDSDDYQKLLYDNLMIPAAVKNQPKFRFKDKHLWVKKATGLVLLSS